MENSVRRQLILFCLLVPLLARADEVLRIGAEDDWYPFTAYRAGVVTGMSADIVRAAFAASDLRVMLHPYPYSRCMELTRSGQLAGCFNTSPDARIRAEYRLPQEALFSDDILLWANHDKAVPVTDLAQLAGLRIAVTIGYEYGSAFDSLENIQRIAVRRDHNGFLMLKRGRVDFIAAYRGTARTLFQEHPELAGHFTPVATLHQPKLYLSFSRYHPQAEMLLEHFDRGMRTIKSNGTYQQILLQWQHQQATD